MPVLLSWLAVAAFIPILVDDFRLLPKEWRGPMDPLSAVMLLSSIGHEVVTAAEPDWATRKPGRACSVWRFSSVGWSPLCPAAPGSGPVEQVTVTDLAGHSSETWTTAGEEAELQDALVLPLCVSAAFAQVTELGPADQPLNAQPAQSDQGHASVRAHSRLDAKKARVGLVEP